MVEVRRRRVQKIDHYDENETNEFINRMFENSNNKFLTEYRPWEEVWQCTANFNSILKERGEVMKDPNVAPPSVLLKNRLGSVYGSTFDKNSIMDGALQAASTPKLIRNRNNAA